jgi:hypothetical protein
MEKDDVVITTTLERVASALERIEKILDEIQRNGL